jgi:hypothetical protein
MSPETKDILTVRKPYVRQSAEHHRSLPYGANGSLGCDFLTSSSTVTMRFLLIASSLLAWASAFAPVVTRVGTKIPVADESQSHRNRRATIVQDGKANGTLPWVATK